MTREEAIEFVNAAATEAERNSRKILAFGALYGPTKEELTRALTAIKRMLREGVPAEKPPTATPTHPMQPVLMDSHGTVRFKPNAIVKYLLDAGPFDMNQLACIPFSDEDRTQLAQLIGYSTSGFGELPYVSDELAERADQERARLVAEVNTKIEKED